MSTPDRIVQLEAALRKLIDHLLNTVYGESDSVIIEARSALEKKTEADAPAKCGSMSIELKCTFCGADAPAKAGL